MACTLHTLYTPFSLHFLATSVIVWGISCSQICYQIHPKALLTSSTSDPLTIARRSVDLIITKSGAQHRKQLQGWYSTNFELTIASSQWVRTRPICYWVRTRPICNWVRTRPLPLVRIRPAFRNWDSHSIPKCSPLRAGFALDPYQCSPSRAGFAFDPWNKQEQPTIPQGGAREDGGSPNSYGRPSFA